MFSPYYAHARRRGPADAENHCALNVALYGARGARWAMTERRRHAVRRESAALRIGPSQMQWRNGELRVDIDEICAPIPRRVRGTVTIRPENSCRTEFYLDPAGRHCWAPIAPRARIEVSLTHPKLRWTGVAYVDSNRGEEPLEAAFSGWSWSRADVPEGTLVLYDVAPRESAATRSSLLIGADGSIRDVERACAVALPSTLWKVARCTRRGVDESLRLVETLEDAPFYNRSLLETHADGHRFHTMHESLDLNRFRSRWVQSLLPFRMPRAF